MEQAPGYTTSNNTYGTLWHKHFDKTLEHSMPYKTLTNRRQVKGDLLPYDKRQVAYVHDPAHPCGINTLSNIPMNTPLNDVRGEFTNVRHDIYSDAQGMWSNAMFNTPGATIDRGVGTYSNLQGAWGRVGPSTYDAMHGNRDWVTKWGTITYEPATLRTMRDHPNVNPIHGLVPIDPVPQNQPYEPRP